VLHFETERFTLPQIIDMENKIDNTTKPQHDAKLPVISSADFKIGDTVLYDGYTCMVKKKQGQKCLAIPMPMGWSYFIPHWADVKRP
jgi:hypothetical protein